MRAFPFIPALLGLLVLVGLSLAQGVPRVAAQGRPNWDPLIAIVWPHDGRGNPVPVTQARAVNVSVWPRNQVSCLDKPSGIGLFQTTDNAPAARVRSDGTLVLRTMGGNTFPTLEFNDLPVETAANPNVQHRFYVQVDGQLSNVWVHAADARTYQPLAVRPDGYATEPPTSGWIQIVWPHDAENNQVPVSRATFVNLSADLFELNRVGYRLSARPDYERALQLLVAEGNDPLRLSSIPPHKTTYLDRGNEYPRWHFNNVPVRPGQQFHFMLGNTGGTSAIWTHAEDARTILPVPQVPPPCLGPAPTPTGTAAPPTPTATATVEPYPYPAP